MIGAPGCARSPKENGFDWVLDRLIAGLDVTAADIAGMGVGGLLMEIPTRPQPRETARPGAPRHGRMRSCSPPAARAAWAGRTSCWRCLTASRWSAAPAERALASNGRRRPSWSPAIRRSASRAALRRARRRRRRTIRDFASGLAGSLKAGIAALPADSRRRADPARRHAGGVGRRSRPADRRLRRSRRHARSCAPRMTASAAIRCILPRAVFAASRSSKATPARAISSKPSDRRSSMSRSARAPASTSTRRKRWRRRRRAAGLTGSRHSSDQLAAISGLSDRQMRESCRR